jgi:hypothetical protein
MADREKGERGEKGEIDDSRLTPEQRLARHVISGANQHCRFIATVTPRKLLPGQTGTLRVLATLQGHAVLPSPANLEFVGQPQQGLVTLGSLVLQPATAGRIESGYIGRPVYENYAVMEMPVTMASSASIGSRHAIGVDLKFDLYDGTSCNPIGRFVDRANTEIEVGPVADPAVRGAAVTATEEPKPVPVPVAKPPEPEKPVPLEANTHPAPSVPEPGPAPTVSTPPQPNAPFPIDDAGGPLPLPVWIGGGVLLLGVVLLLARRK